MVADNLVYCAQSSENPRAVSHAAGNVEETLEDLQVLVRRPGGNTPDRLSMSRRIPHGLADDRQMLHLGYEEREAFERATTAVLADIRFEHLDSKAEAKVWRLLCDAFLDRGRDFVPAFVQEHAEEPQDRTCFFPIDFLTVDKRREVLSLDLLPVNDPEVPEATLGFSLAPPVGSVAAIPAFGTHYDRMKERSAQVADHSLRVLRIALRKDSFVHDRQLRFRRGEGYSFGQGLAGWQLGADASWELRLDDDLENLVHSQSISGIGVEPTDDVEKKAALALKWIDRGGLATDRLESLLFFFFALEALLGDRSEGLKAHGLAFRRAMLSVATRGSFVDPNRVYFLYDEVRSAAVHGGEPSEITNALASKFAWDVRRALNEYLDYARDQGIRRRGRLLKALDTHPERERLVAWLRENGGKVWEQFLTTSTHES